MSVYAYTYVWDTSKLKHSALLMLLALADFADQDTGECYPSIKTLAKMMRMSERNVQILLRKLEDAGAIEIKENAGMATGTGNTNRYTISGYAKWRQAVKEISPHEKKAVKNISSLEVEGVKNSASRGENSIAKGVKEISPKPSLEPSDKTITLDVASDAKPKPIPATVINPMKDAIVAAFGWSWEHMTKGEKGLVQVAAKELCAVGFEIDRVASLHAWCKAKFPNPGPRCLSQHLSEYRASRLDTPAKTAQIEDLASYKPKDPNEYIGVQNNVA